MGVPAEFVKKLSLLGISGIANLLCCIKMAKVLRADRARRAGHRWHGLSADMYTSRVKELEEADGPYTTAMAAADFAEHLHGVRTDVMEELTYTARKRIHNLKYYTWVEQQGKTYEEINQQWYDEHYWTDMHAQASEIDALIDEFNDETGVLKKL